MSEPKKDYIMASFGLLLWLSAIPMVVAAIWTDGRWFAMAALVAILGVVAIGFSIQLDKQYERDARNKGFEE